MWVGGTCPASASMLFTGTRATHRSLYEGSCAVVGDESQVSDLGTRLVVASTLSAPARPAAPDTRPIETSPVIEGRRTATNADDVAVVVARCSSREVAASCREIFFDRYFALIYDDFASPLSVNLVAVSPPRFLLLPHRLPPLIRP